MPGNLCAYARLAGCDKCTSIVYAKCPKFIKQRVRSLVCELQPFDFAWDKNYKPYQFSKVIHLKGTVSRTSISLLKSSAMNWALENNSKVYNLSTDQVLNRVLESSREDSPIIKPYAGYYLDLQRKKGTSKIDEIQSCIESFVNKALDAGCQLFILDRYAMDQPKWFSVNSRS